MQAVCWYGAHDVRVKDVPDPYIEDSEDVILRVRLTAICGSDLHLYGGFIPGMKRGDILGHEFLGEVVEVGSAVKNLAVGDRVVVPFAIACGRCVSCRRDLWSLCDNSNPNAGTLRDAVRRQRLRAVRLLAPVRRILRRTGRIRPGAVRRHRAAAAAAAHHRRAGAVSLGHPADRLHGRRELRACAPATSSRCGARARSDSSRSGPRSCSARRG